MPPIFKALATIAAWVLFIVGFWTVAVTFTGQTITVTGGDIETPPMSTYVVMAIGFTGLTLSVVVMKLRKMLE